MPIWEAAGTPKKPFRGLTGPLDSSMVILGDKIESELAELVPEMEEKERPQAVTSAGVAGYY